MRIDLTELGEGQFVEIRDPKKLRWNEQKAIIAGFKDNSIGTQLDVTEGIAITLCKSGNVLDEDNAPIIFPLTAETVGNAPAALIEAVAKSFADAKKEAVAKN